MIIDHTHPRYIMARNRIGESRFNGAYYYSKEIVENIIPRVETDRHWITVELKNIGLNHSIVFVHNRLHPEWYEHYKNHNDVIFICSVPHMCEELKHLGTTILLPLSVDIEHVKKFRRKKDREVAFAGRKAKLKETGSQIPTGTDFICGMPRDQFLSELARYRKVYAVDRVAIEAKILGCEVLPYEPNNMEDIWDVIDNKEAAKILQQKLNEVDK